MPNREKLMLKWGDFHPTVTSALQDIRGKSQLFDITLAVETRQILAHKLILSACSPFFRNIITTNPHHHPLLYLKGVGYQNLVSVLDFMYIGQVSVAQEDLSSFLDVAENLQVKGLTRSEDSSKETAGDDCTGEGRGRRVSGRVVPDRESPATSGDHPARTHHQLAVSRDQPARSCDKQARPGGKPDKLRDQPDRSPDQPDRSRDQPDRSLDQPARSRATIPRDQRPHHVETVVLDSDEIKVSKVVNSRKRFHPLVTGEVLESAGKRRPPHTASTSQPEKKRTSGSSFASRTSTAREAAAQTNCQTTGGSTDATNCQTTGGSTAATICQTTGGVATVANKQSPTKRAKGSNSSRNLTGASLLYQANCERFKAANSDDDRGFPDNLSDKEHQRTNKRNVKKVLLEGTTNLSDEDDSDSSQMKIPSIEIDNAEEDVGGTFGTDEDSNDHENSAAAEFVVEKLLLKEEITISENLHEACRTSTLAGERREGGITPPARSTCESASTSATETGERDALEILNQSLEDLTKAFIKQVPSRDWQCLSCLKLFYGEQSCQHHVEAVHMVPVGHECPLCQLQFPTIKATKDHVLSIHRNPPESTLAGGSGEKEEITVIDL